MKTKAETAKGNHDVEMLGAKPTLSQKTGEMDKVQQEPFIWSFLRTVDLCWTLWNRPVELLLHQPDPSTYYSATEILLTEKENMAIVVSWQKPSFILRTRQKKSVDQTEWRTRCRGRSAAIRNPTTRKLVYSVLKGGDRIFQKWAPALSKNSVVQPKSPTCLRCGRRVVQTWMGRQTHLHLWAHSS